MEPQVVMKPEIKLVGLEFNPEVHGWHLVATLWYKLCWLMPRIKDPVDPGVSYGFMFARDCPLPGIDTYLAGVEVASFDDVPEGAATGTIPAGEYAVFTVDGGIGNTPGAYGYINDTWMPQSGYKEARCGAVEAYGKRFVPSSESQFEIWVAVEAR